MRTPARLVLITLAAAGMAVAPLGAGRAADGLPSLQDAPSNAPRRGIEGKTAPAWNVDDWINLPDGVERIDVSDYRGKVLYLYCFQSWCPGCHSRGFPTLQKLIEHYDGNDDVAFVAVQTVFEGFQSNTVDSAWKTAERYDLAIPVGHSGTGGKQSELMRRYRNGGTPWTIVIDRAGVVRYNAFHAAPERAIRMIDMLRRESAPASAPTSLPASRGGQSIVGKKFPRVTFDATFGPESLGTGTGTGAKTGTGATRKAKATLYRWWTDDCRHCRASLPAIERLRTTYGDKGLDVVGVYHPKPAGTAADTAGVLRDAEALGYKGPLAIDADWSELKRVFPADDRPPATSVSVLVDGEGVVRFVHPGPELFPSNDPKHARQNDDYRRLERAIKALLHDAR